MITRTMTAKEARDNFTDLLGAVYYGKESIIVEKKGRQFAVVISPEQYEGLKREQEKAWSIIEAIQARNKDKDPEKVLADVTRAVEEVRKARYDKSQKTTSKSSS